VRGASLKVIVEKSITDLRYGWSCVFAGARQGSDGDRGGQPVWPGGKTTQDLDAFRPAPGQFFGCFNHAPPARAGKNLSQFLRREIRTADMGDGAFSGGLGAGGHRMRSISWRDRNWSTGRGLGDNHCPADAGRDVRGSFLAKGVSRRAAVGNPKDSQDLRVLINCAQQCGE
jgi:hypothetical protein